MEYQVHQSQDRIDEWNVEAINHDGDGEIYGAAFYGPKAQERANEYAAWKASQESPQLVTGQDEREQCCVMLNPLVRCPKRSEFWVGKDGLDQYTHVCKEHVADVIMDGDVVRELSVSGQTVG